ncbi:hypothetical protein HJA72_004308 [Vibrio fluvialis]|nr:hypothetical protein [Vibrio fluvialis]
MDVTNDAAISWSSSDLGIATISSSVTKGSGKGVATGVAVGAVTIRAAGRADGKMFFADAELVVTNAVEIANISANGHVFPTEDGFPSTGFIGAEFTLNVSASAQDYIWGSDATWVSVDEFGKVSFMATGTSNSVTISALPKVGGTPLTYTFTITKWFHNTPTAMDWPDAANWCFMQGWNQPPYQDLSNGKNKRSVGTIWSEWGVVSMYNGAGFIQDYYWGSTKYSSGHHLMNVNNGAILWADDYAKRGVVCSVNL